MPLCTRQNPINRASYSASGGGGSFTPTRIVTFDGLSNNQSVSADTGGSVAGKRFDFWGDMKATAYGTVATTSLARSGKTSCAKLSIRSGSDGLQGGTGTSDGSFGGGLVLTPSSRPGEGMWLHTGMYIYFPSSFNSTVNNIQLKWIRWQRFNGSVTTSATTSKTEMGFLDGAWTPFASPVGTAGQLAGFCYVVEGHDLAETDVASVITRLPTYNAFNYIEYAMYITSDPSTSIWRTWVNDQMCYERVGTAVKWYGHTANAPGDTAQWRTRTLSSSVPIIDAGQTLGDPMIFTYWNGFSTVDNTCYIDSLCYASLSSQASLTATDEFGNKMMGSGVL